MIRNIISGLKAYGNSFNYLADLGLWKYFGIPMLISLGLFLLIGLSSWGLGDDLGDWMAGAWVWDWGKETVTTLSHILGSMAIILLGVVLYKNLVLALSAPFMSKLHNRYWVQLWRALRLNMRNLGMELMLTLLFFLLGLVPVIGLASPVLIFAVQAYYAGFGNMDYTLERHMSLSESTRFVRANRGMAMGNGIVFMLMLIIPVIGVVLVLPLSVTASSHEVIHKLTHISDDQG
jgi:CysZ protein